MKEFTLISLACLSSIFVSCASGDKKKSVLEERAGYGFAPPPVAINGSGPVKYVPTRVPERVLVAWLHAKELPSKDYFWGSWLSIVVTPEAWEMKRVEAPTSHRGGQKKANESIKGPPGKGVRK